MESNDKLPGWAKDLIARIVFAVMVFMVIYLVFGPSFVYILHWFN